MRLQAFYAVAASLGLEPRQRDPESLVLPLHYEAKEELHLKRSSPDSQGGVANSNLTIKSEIRSSKSETSSNFSKPATNGTRFCQLRWLSLLRFGFFCFEIRYSNFGFTKLFPRLPAPLPLRGSFRFWPRSCVRSPPYCRSCRRRGSDRGEKGSIFGRTRPRREKQRW